MEDASTRDGHDVVAASEAMRAMPVGVGHAAGGLAVAVREHLVLREDLDILKDALAVEGFGGGLDVDEDDAGDAGGEPIHNPGEWRVKEEKLVVVDVKDPVHAHRAALRHRAAHLPLLTLHEGVVVVGGGGVVRVDRVVIARGHGDEIGEFVGVEQGKELRRVLHVNEDVIDAE